MSRPNGLIANKGLELLTLNTPNGVKASIMLEELKEAYGKPDYVVQKIDITTNVQKEPWFTKLGPNGRIPVLVDHDAGGFAIQEGLAILSYLARKFDTEHRLSFTSDPELSQCEQWSAFQHGGLGPMQGQANHFYRFAKERIPYATQRYIGETERLYGVLDTHLKDKTYLVGEKFSVADITTFGWVNTSAMIGVDLEKQFPSLYKWWALVKERPGVKRGMNVPDPAFFASEAQAKRLKEDPEYAEKEKNLKDLADKAKEQYNYKYTSP